MAGPYELDTAIRLSASFTDTFTGEPFDPTEVRIFLQPPSGDPIDYSSLRGELGHDAVGVYHFEVFVHQPGVWRWKYQALGNTAITSPDTSFTVASSVFSGLLGG